MDEAGRVRIPKWLRGLVGLVPGKVQVTVDGEALRIEPNHDVGSDDDGGLEWVGGRLVIPASGVDFDDAWVERMRNSDQR